MPNMKKEKTPMPKRPPEERIKDFKEVELGYGPKEAKEEASRCLGCKLKPCVSGCPVGIDIPGFISEILNDDVEAAYSIIEKSSGLPAVCGRVCPQEKQCELKCVRGKAGEPVAIGGLERYVADEAVKLKKGAAEPEGSNGIKAAVVGAGPSGLTCARELALSGFEVTIYEALHAAGGVLSYGIPEFRLPRSVLNAEINNLKEMGVKIVTNAVVGKTLSVDDLFALGFKAVYLSTGAGTPNFTGIPGEGLGDVYSANEFLTRINLMKAYDERFDTPIKRPNDVVVIGGGNVAMDAARCAKRLGARNVTVIYRRTEKEMPARSEEIVNAKEEGVEFLFLSAPKRILGSGGKVEGVRYVKTRLSRPDESGRRRPVEVLDEKFVKSADCVIIAIGNSPNSIAADATPDIKRDEKGRIIVEAETLETSKKGVYAGGDAVTGAATVILAMQAGKKAAAQIRKNLAPF